MSIVATERVIELLGEQASDVRLAEVALWAARARYPDLDVAAYLRRLDAWGDTVRGRLPAGASAEDIVVTLNRYLFDEVGLRGNMEEYYDPRNSYLNEVMDRGLGIPITLSIIYIDVGRQAGLPLEGVSFPGHFLVKFSVEHGEVVLDPFSDGVSLQESDLEALLGQLKAAPELSPRVLTRLLDSASPGEVLVRMLRNLKGIYIHRDALQDALVTIDLILAIEPNLAGELRDRAVVYERLECFRAASDDYRRALSLAPDAEDADRIRDRLIELQRRNPPLH